MLLSAFYSEGINAVTYRLILLTVSEDDINEEAYDYYKLKRYYLFSMNPNGKLTFSDYDYKEYYNLIIKMNNHHRDVVYLTTDMIIGYYTVMLLKEVFSLAMSIRFDLAQKYNIFILFI